MRRALVATLLVILAAAPGCIKRADEDPFAYLTKPLYADSFDLGSVTNGRETREFRVEDGSIVELRLDVWVNATEGAADVRITDPSGHLVRAGSGSGTVNVPIELGVWRVDIRTEGTPSGDVSVRVSRS